MNFLANRREKKDIWAKSLIGLNIFVWLLLIVIMLIFHRAQPEFETFFDRFYLLKLRTFWDIKYVDNDKLILGRKTYSQMGPAQTRSLSRSYHTQFTKFNSGSSNFGNNSRECFSLFLAPSGVLNLRGPILISLLNLRGKANIYLT